MERDCNTSPGINGKGEYVRSAYRGEVNKFAASRDKLPKQTIGPERIYSLKRLTE